MTTMLYDKETLEPRLLTGKSINDNDVNIKFHVINGAWDGTFNEGRVTIHHHEYNDRDYGCEFKCYKFSNNYDKEQDGWDYNDYFVEFRRLVEIGEIQ